MNQEKKEPMKDTIKRLLDDKPVIKFGLAKPTIPDAKPQPKKQTITEAIAAPTIPDPKPITEGLSRPTIPDKKPSSNKPQASNSNNKPKK